MINTVFNYNNIIKLKGEIAFSLQKIIHHPRRYLFLTDCKYNRPRTKESH